MRRGELIWGLCRECGLRWEEFSRDGLAGPCPECGGMGLDTTSFPSFDPPTKEMIQRGAEELAALGLLPEQEMHETAWALSERCLRAALGPPKGRDLEDGRLLNNARRRDRAGYWRESGDWQGGEGNDAI